MLVGNTPRYRRLLDDFSIYPLVDLWTDTGISGFSDKKFYVVQTNPKVIERCILMATDPGDLVLDPTCGSGAFLFAALNILEPLYESSIKRMQEFVQNSPKGKFKFFEQILNKVNAPEHPNLQYFIYKSIILNNLFGVDIMNEAVEIAKLRLFLKLVATVDADYSKENLGLEPLPDVDFNIRAGNTLVGYATKKQIDEIACGSYKPFDPPIIRADGYVVKSLEAALWAFHRCSSFRDGCLLVVNLGDDADTSGAIFGQLAGAYYGESDIPLDWLQKLALRPLIEDYANRLFQLAETQA